MNPLLLAKAAPYAIAALIAFALAWGIQSLRLTSAQLETQEVKQEYTAFRQEQTRIFQEHRDAADLQRNKASEAFDRQSKVLADAIESRDVLDRCIRAGKCVRVQQQSANTPGVGLSAPRIIDATVSNTVPSFTGDAAINDCAVTTLQLNHLQADIEAQPGY